MLGDLRRLEARLWGRLPNGRLAVPTITREYLTLEDLRDYSGISVRKLRDFVTDPVHPLPHHRADGKVRVRRSDFDAWMARHRRVGREDLTALVNEVMRGLTGVQTT